MAARIRHEVEAEGLTLMNKAANLLTPEARQSAMRRQLIDKLEGIIRESVKPMERIEGIRVLHVEGSAAAPAARATATAAANIADSVVNSALRFRAQAPLVDQLLREIGVQGGDIGQAANALLEGAVKKRNDQGLYVERDRRPGRRGVGAGARLQRPAEVDPLRRRVAHRERHAPDRIGCVRNFRLRDGGMIREQLLTLSDYDYQCSYSILESPMGVENYVRHLKLTPVTDGNRTFAEWWAEFDCAPERERELAEHRAGSLPGRFRFPENHLKRIRVRRSAVIDAPIERVWAVLRDFNSHGAWHPAVGESRIERNEPSDQVGCVRNFFLQDGNHIREQLLALSDRDYISTYCILDATLPMRNYVATVQLKRVTDGDRTFWHWESTFDVPKGEREFEQLVGVGVYEAGFRALSEYPRDGWTPVASCGRGRGARRGRHGVRRPEVLQFRTIREDAGEVRIRQTAVGVNYIDVYIRKGLYRMIEPPAPIGMEAAGVVVESRSSRFRPAIGSPTPARRPGAYVTMRALPADLVLLPDHVSDETAAAVMLKGMTAEYLLHRTHRVPGRCRAGTPRRRRGLAAASGPGARRARHRHGLERSEGRARASQRLRRGHRHARLQIRLRMSRRADVIYDGLGQAAAPENFAALAMRGHWVSYGRASPLQPLSLAESWTFSQPVLFTSPPRTCRKWPATYSGHCAMGRSGRRCGTVIRSRRRPTRIATSKHAAPAARSYCLLSFRRRFSEEPPVAGGKAPHVLEPQRRAISVTVRPSRRWSLRASAKRARAGRPSAPFP